jgi:hypothetical protein
MAAGTEGSILDWCSANEIKDGKASKIGYGR